MFLALLPIIGCGGSDSKDRSGNSHAGDSRQGDAPLALGDSGPPPTACSEISAVSCFSSYECATAERCETVNADFGLACCTTGARGTGAAGVPCTTGSDCQSAICINRNDGAYYCSATCSSVADCPANMQQCLAIAFSGSPDDWCFPN